MSPQGCAVRGPIQVTQQGYLRAVVNHQIRDVQEKVCSIARCEGTEGWTEFSAHRFVIEVVKARAEPSPRFVHSDEGGGGRTEPLALGEVERLGSEKRVGRTRPRTGNRYAMCAKRPS